MAWTIYTFLYSFFGLGVMVGCIVAVAVIQVSKGRWKLLMVNFEMRDGSKVANILKCKKTTDKNNKTSYWVKPTVLFSGFKALLKKAVMMPPPKYGDITIGKDGGSIMLTYSPTDNVYLPVKTIINEGQMKLIPKFELLKTWFKTTIVEMFNNKLLRPSMKWEKIVPIAMMGMFIVVLVIWIIVMKTGADVVASATSDVQSWYQSMGGFADSVSGVQKAIPVS